MAFTVGARLSCLSLSLQKKKKPACAAGSRLQPGVSGPERGAAPGAQQRSERRAPRACLSCPVPSRAAAAWARASSAAREAERAGKPLVPGAERRQLEGNQQIGVVLIGRRPGSAVKRRVSERPGAAPPAGGRRALGPRERGSNPRAPPLPCRRAHHHGRLPSI